MARREHAHAAAWSARLTQGGEQIRAVIARKFSPAPLAAVARKAAERQSVSLIPWRQ